MDEATVKELRESLKHAVFEGDLIMCLIRSGHNVSFYRNESESGDHNTINLRIDNRRPVVSCSAYSIRDALLIAISSLIEEKEHERRTRFETLEM